jgi:hypothetical protein
MAPRLALATGDVVDGGLVGDELEPADADGLDAATELSVAVVFEDWPSDDGAAVPPTLAQAVRARAATATRPDLIKIGRAVARP